MSRKTTSGDSGRPRQAPSARRGPAPSGGRRAEQPGQEAGPVLVVVHHEHPFRRPVRPRSVAAREGRGSRPRSIVRAGLRGRRTTNSLPRPEPVAARPDAAAVHLDQAADQRQADPQPPLAAVERPLGLGEQVEDAGQQLRGDPDAVVADPDDRLVPPRARPPVRSARPARCTWRRCSAGWRGPAPAGPRRPPGGRARRDSETDSSWRRDSISGRAVSTARATASRRSTAPLAELDLAAVDAGDVEQVVDQPGQVADLPLGDVPDLLGLGAVEAVRAEHVQGVQDRGEGVAQLVRRASPGTRPCAGRPRGSRGRVARCR